LEHEDELVEKPDDELGLRALHRDAVALHDDLLVGEGLFDLAQVGVARPEQPGHEVIAGDEALGAQGGRHDGFTPGRGAP